MFHSVPYAAGYRRLGLQREAAAGRVLLCMLGEFAGCQHPQECARIDLLDEGLLITMMRRNVHYD